MDAVAIVRIARSYHSKPITRSGCQRLPMNEEPTQPDLESEVSADALISGISVEGAANILFELLMEVVRRHQPEIEGVFEGGANVSDFSPELMARALQAQGIWFQLLSIADQNAAMRRRRHIERTRGRDALRGTFDHVLAEAAKPASGRKRSRSFCALCASAPSSPPTRRSPSASRCWRSTARSISCCASSRQAGGRSASGRQSLPTFAIRSSSCG